MEKLIAVPRSQRGKSSARRLRAQGMVPAVFYGARYDSTPIAIKAKELEQALAHRKGLVNLIIEGTGEYEVVVREIQRDPTTEKIQHVDLLGITRGEKMISTVAIELVGEPVGVKENGGILEFHSRYLEIECLPKNLPEKIVVDVSEIDIGESVHVEDLKVEYVDILNAPQTTIASVATPTVVKEVIEEVEEVAEEGEAAEEEGEAEEKSEK